MIDIVLVHPEIPPNTGNVIRLAANTGARLHLVEPLGFSMDDRQLKRGGLDYHELASVRVHRSWSACGASLGERRFFAFAPRAATLFTEVRYAANDVLVFGREADGRRPEGLAGFAPEARVRLRMRPGNRCCDLPNAVAAEVLTVLWRTVYPMVA